jgi:CheY-like chemotaxis protein
MAMSTKPALLVVEDELLIRMDLADTLREAGFRVAEAGNADEAIEILSCRTDIRVVFTDIQMPGSMDGIALSHYVRDRYPPTLIVVCSGNVKPDATGLPTDVQFLAKPIHQDKLRAALTFIERQLSA